MNPIHRVLVNILSDQLDKSKYFYTTLFQFTVAYDSDWFVQLTTERNHIEIGLIKNDSELVPNEIKQNADGFYITIVTESSDTVFEKAKNEGLTILTEPTDTPYGQRSFLLKDPNGVTIDVSSMIPGFNMSRE
jgi:predicted enzyme related to lactoylglutathione lyase